MNLRDRRVLVTWGDATAAATIHAALGVSARVTVVAPDVCASVQDLADRRRAAEPARQA